MLSPILKNKSETFSQIQRIQIKVQDSKMCCGYELITFWTQQIIHKKSNSSTQFTKLACFFLTLELEPKVHDYLQLCEFNYLDFFH